MPPTRRRERPAASAALVSRGPGKSRHRQVGPGGPDPLSSPTMPAGVRYRVVKKIAHGGMAEIFLAFQSGAEGFQKPVVLKRILPSLASDPAFVRMLVDEAHIASTLNHSNLVQVLDLRRSQDEQYFLVLEFVDGWSLEQLRRRALA